MAKRKHKKYKRKKKKKNNECKINNIIKNYHHEYKCQHKNTKLLPCNNHLTIRQPRLCNLCKMSEDVAQMCDGCGQYQISKENFCDLDPGILSILEHPLHFKLLIQSSPQLLWNYANDIALKNGAGLCSDHWTERISMTIFFLNNKKNEIYNIWNHKNVDVNFECIFLMIRRWYSKNTFKHDLWNHGEMAGLIYLISINHYFQQKPKFKHAYVYKQNIHLRTEITQELAVIVKDLSLRINCDLNSLLRFWKIRSYKQIKCGNENCNKDYLKDNYNINVNDNILGFWFCLSQMAIMVNNINGEWNKRSITKKWKVCKNCKRVKYCSKKCQKIAWKYQQHKTYCYVLNDNEK